MSAYLDADLEVMGAADTELKLERFAREMRLRTSHPGERRFSKP
jgi:hypothetical protein